MDPDGSQLLSQDAIQGRRHNRPAGNNLGNKLKAVGVTGCLQQRTRFFRIVGVGPDVRVIAIAVVGRRLAGWPGMPAQKYIDYGLLVDRIVERVADTNVLEGAFLDRYKR